MQNAYIAARAQRMLACVALLFGCAEPTAKDEGTISEGPGLEDAGADADTSPESMIREIELNPADPDELQRWKDASEFEITYSATGCFGTCPAYDMTVDQAGHMRFHGTNHVARPGTYEKTVEAEEVRSLFDQLLDVGYLQLNPTFASKEDGCVLVTDGSSHTMTLTAAGETKVISYYSGCMIRGTAHEALTALVRAFGAFKPKDTFMGAVPYCKNPKAGVLFEVNDDRKPMSYVIRDENDKSVGLIRLAIPEGETPARTKVSVSSCDGEQLFSSSSLLAYGCGYAILPEEEEDALTFHWPAVERAANAALIGVESISEESKRDEYELRLLEVDQETKLRVRVGDACDASK